MSEDEDDSDITDATLFALKVRGRIREPERWASIIRSARGLMAIVSKTPIPDRMSDVTILALAYVASMRCAKQLPPGDEAREEVEEILQRISSYA
jgi:hypothetical protein